MNTELLERKTNLERTREELTTKLASTRSALDDLTEPRNADELLDREVQAGALVAAIARLDAGLETVDKELSTAQEVQRRAEQLDAITLAAEDAQKATAEEERAYTILAGELGLVLDGFIAARDNGNRARTHLHALLTAQTPAYPGLLYWGAVTTTQETAAVRLEAELRAQGVDVAPALNANADLPYGNLLTPLLEAHQRETSRTPLEAA